MSDGLFVYGGVPWRILSAVCVLGGFALPFVVPTIVAVRMATSHRFLRVTATIASVPVGMVAGLVAVLFGACYGPEPGEGPKARLGYQHAAPLIDALDRYHERYGFYPRALSYLVPEYLSASQLPVDTGSVPLSMLRLTDTEYEVMFSYNGPASNDCRFSSTARDWVCGGAW